MNNDRLKFRVWNESTQCYDPNIQFYFLNVGGTLFEQSEFYQNGTFKLYPAESKIAEQCTGLRDKNGNLIYEGDVVRGAENTVGTVKFGKHGYDSINVGFYIQWDMKHPWRYDIGYWTTPENPDCIEIIGNIHTQKD